MEHVCAGSQCPHVIQTREGFVCTANGHCLSTALMMFSQDPNDGTQVLLNTKTARAPEGMAHVSDHDKNGFKMQTATRTAGKKRDADAMHHQFERVCYQTVCTLLKSPLRDEIAGRVRKKACDASVKAMLAYVRRQRERCLEFSLAKACAIGSYAYAVRAGRYATVPASDDFVRHVVDRVCKLNAHFSFDSRVKQTRAQYKTVAFLYLLKNNVYHKGSIIAHKERTLCKMLPDLSELDLFGFEKNRYTEAIKNISFAQMVFGPTAV